MKRIVFIILIFLFQYVSYGYDVKGFSNALYIGTQQNLNKYKLVKVFCDNVNKYDDGLFNSKESLFLEILCNNLGIHTDYKYKSSTDLGLKTNHLKDYENLFENAKNDKNFGIYARCKVNGGYLTDNESLNNVNFACVSTSIFNELANDYLNIATFISYGGFYQENGLKKFEKDFYLGKDCKDSYLNSDDDDKKWCNHKETYNYFKDLVSGLKDGIKELYFLDVKASDVYEKISGTNGTNHFLNVKDKLYNELYFYSLFLKYYASMIKLESTSLSLKSDNYNGIKQMKLVNQKQVLQAEKDILLARYSIKRSFTVLKDIYWTLPLHIGYMALKEDILKLMKSLAKIYTPIDQLRTKLKSVQDKDKK